MIFFDQKTQSMPKHTLGYGAKWFDGFWPKNTGLNAKSSGMRRKMPTAHITLG